MTILRVDEDFNSIRKAGKVVRETLALVESKVKPGVTTAELDAAAEKAIRSLGGEPAFKGYKGYPATICASVNDVVVHGIPTRKRVLAEGDIVGVDVGARKEGFYADAARTFAVGKVSETAFRLMEVTRESLKKGILQAIEGNRLFDISSAIQTYVNRNGFKEVRAFVGHGIGRQLHEPPEVPNWGVKGRGPILKSGLVLAVEPMVNAGTRDVRVLEDGWTAVTADGELSAHFEETIIIARDEAEIIT
ncbi:MAG: type I methionyl aminopeptidase [Candidatus Omnitrophica bacterium]|nr:type I methionyl aminopeptidase [Candidatus Omnitrophota bacterium]MDD4012846.1 type I methionyl aminopeptidase [Candidatus Omnitrophota bacterium]